MLKHFFKHCILLFHPFSSFLFKRDKIIHPYLCIITPVFDPALKPLKDLIRDLQSQTFPHFIHVSISNGLSPKIKKYISKLQKNDPRFIYDQLKFQPTPDWQKLLINIGKRRTYAFRKYDAVRYVFIDANSRVANNSYIAKLYMSDSFVKKDIIITQTLFPDSTLLPFFPINVGRIDITNYSFSRSIARKFRYPQNIDPEYGPANDFRFFKKINHKNNTVFFPFLGIKKDVSHSYKSIGRLFHDTIGNIK
ncbi:hypothetical protein HZC27_03875 [Candidatus Roizmanbacteria bacterium]|nr:hypothetical protein [Candidatus Roizmanbacteria bacterium]